MGITLSPTKFASLDWTDFKDEYGNECKSMKRTVMNVQDFEIQSTIRSLMLSGIRK